MLQMFQGIKTFECKESMKTIDSWLSFIHAKPGKRFWSTNPKTAFVVIENVIPVQDMESISTIFKLNKR